MKAISPKSTYKYICKEDRDLPPEEQTVFTLRHLSVEQDAFLTDKGGYLTDDGYNMHSGTVGLMCLDMGLVEISNMPAEDGAPAELARDETRSAKTYPGNIRPWKRECLDAIPKAARIELVAQIRFGDELEESEEKN